MQFDPALARIVAGMPPLPDTTQAPDAQYGAVREAAHAYYALHPSPAAPDVTEVDDVVAASNQPVRVYRPADVTGVLPALVWVHGGGFTLGMIDADNHRCRGYVRDAGCVVVSVEYRLAPEHPYPAGLDDCWAALNWTFQHAEGLGIDPTKVMIGGASAGGCLAAALALRARDRGGPDLVFQMLVYPSVDDRLDTPSSREKLEVPILPRRFAEASWRRYLRAFDGDQVPSDAAPGRSSDLAGLPPAYVLTAEHDPLRDEGNEYARRLQAAGVPTELHQFAGTFHGFEAIGLSAPIVARALAEQGRVIADALHDPLVRV